MIPPLLNIYDVVAPAPTVTSYASRSPSDRDDEGSGSSKKGKRRIPWWVWLAIFGTIGGVLICIACGLVTLCRSCRSLRRSCLRRVISFERRFAREMLRQSDTPINDGPLA